MRNLGGSLINSGMHSLEQAFSAQIEAVEEASSFTAAALSTGSILLRRPQEVADYMFGALSAMEHVSFVIVADRNGNFIQVDRGRADGILVPQFVPKTDETHALAGLISSSRDKTAPFWSGPAFYPQRQHTYIAHVQPILSDGPDGSDYEGLVLMAMSMERLSEVTSDISTGLVQVFMINPQTYGLIAHPALSEVFNLLSPTSPLIELENVPDTFCKPSNRLKQSMHQAMGYARDTKCVPAMTPLATSGLSSSKARTSARQVADFNRRPFSGGGSRAAA